MDNNTTKRRSRLWILWVAVFCGILVLLFIRNAGAGSGAALSQYQFEKLLDEGQIVKAVIRYSPQDQFLTEVTGEYLKDPNDQKSVVPFKSKVRLKFGLEDKLLRLPYVETQQQNTTLLSVLWSLLPIVLIAAFIWFFFVRQIKKVYKGQSLQERIDKEVEQQQRFDKILDRWEQQADRMDKILARGEQQSTPQS